MSPQLQPSAPWDLPCSAGWPLHRGARLAHRAPAVPPPLRAQRQGRTPSAARGKVTIVAAEVFPSTLSSIRRKPLRCDGVMQRGASLRLPRFWEPRLSPLPAFREARHRSRHGTAPACSFHWNPRLLAIYILFLERDRKPNESESSMVTSAPALTGLPALMEIPTTGLTLCLLLRQGPGAPQPAPSLLGVLVGTRNCGCPREQGPPPPGPPALLAANAPAGVSHGRQKRCCPDRVTCWNQGEDRSLGKPAASLPPHPKP